MHVSIPLLLFLLLRYSDRDGTVPETVPNKTRTKSAFCVFPNSELTGNSQLDKREFDFNIQLVHEKVFFFSSVNHYGLFQYDAIYCT